MRAREFENLGPGEIAFHLVTNQPVDARRALEFVSLFLWEQMGDIEFPQYTIEIESLRRGSLIGRIRTFFPFLTKKSAEDRFERYRSRYQNKIDPAFERLKSSRAAASSADSDKKTWTTNRKMMWLAVAGLVIPALAALTSEHANPRAENAAELMHFDAVTSIIFATANDEWTVHRHDVPAYERIARKVEPPAAPSIDDVPEPREPRVRMFDGSDRNGPIRQTYFTPDDARADGVRAHRFSGTVIDIGEAYIIQTDTPAEGEPGIAESYILIPPEGQLLQPGAHYEVVGRDFILPEILPLLIAKAVRQTKPDD